MSTQRRILNHYKRWNIQIDEERAFEEFKNRLLNHLEIFLKGPDKGHCEFLFAQLYGSRYGHDRTSSELRQLDDFTLSSLIGNAIDRANNLLELVTILQFLLMAAEQVDPIVLDKLASCIHASINLSPLIQIRMVKRGESVIFYPAGASLLDEGTVSDVLEWLEEYPKAAKQFQRALEIYLEKDKSRYRNLLDNLRLAIEQLLRGVLKNEKSLENQQEVLLKWLNNKGIHQQVVTSYKQLLFGPYVQYQNDAVKHVKHNEVYSENEVEFMIYMTGTFMRLVLQLALGETRGIN